MSRPDLTRDSLPALHRRFEIVGSPFFGEVGQTPGGRSDMEDVGSEWTERNVGIRYSGRDGSQITAGIKHDEYAVLDIHCMV